MRWLSLAVLGACQFSPGTYTGGDPDARSSSDALADAPLTTKRVRQLDLDDSKIIGGPHAGFPLLVSLEAGWLKSAASGGDVAHPLGFDLRFSLDAAGGTVLAHEIEDYQATAGVVVAWVQVPALDASTTLYLHYGDPAATPPAAQPAEVWNSDYAFVHHLASDVDSTSNQIGFQTVGVMPATGKIGPGRSFDGATSYANGGSSVAIDDIFTGGGTVEAWFFAESYGENARGRIVDKGGGLGWTMFVNNNGVNASFDFLHICTGNNAVGQWAMPANIVTSGVWHHVAVVYNSDDVANDPVLYLDGVSRTVSTIINPNGDMDTDADTNLIAGSSAVPGTRTFDGIIDEIRMSSTQRTAGWIQTQHANQATPSTFMTVSEPL